MKSCTFIGHRNVPNQIKNILANAIEDLILNKGVTRFYIGTHGDFDTMVRNILEEMIIKYPRTSYNVVLAYFPLNSDNCMHYSNGIYPHGLEYVPPRFAIIERNKWMIKNSDYLICYVKNTFSNAYKFKEFAEKQGKIIIKL